MDLKKKIDSLLEKHGRKIEIFFDETPIDTFALIQPLRYKNKMYLELERSEIGIKDNTCFLYIGPAEYDLRDSNVTIRCEDGSFSVSRADMIYFGNTPSYVWAVLNKRIKDGYYD